MVDLTTPLVSGAFAFVGAACAAGLKYNFDRRSYDRDNNRRKTESAIRHLRALSILFEPVCSGQPTTQGQPGRESYFEHLEAARGDCAGLEMYGTRRLRRRAGAVLGILREPHVNNPSECKDPAIPTLLSAQLLAESEQLTRDWRVDQRRRGN